MFIYFSCYFDIEQGHSDRFKWCIVQTEASPGKPGSNVKTRSEMGCRFSGSGLKRGIWGCKVKQSSLGNIFHLLAQRVAFGDSVSKLKEEARNIPQRDAQRHR